MITDDVQKQRIARNRERKAGRFVAHFVAKMKEAGVADPMEDKAALEKALAIARNASSEQWASLAKELKEKDPPSGTTIECIVRRFQSQIAYLDRKASEDREIIDELFRQRREGEMGDEGRR